MTEIPATYSIERFVAFHGLVEIVDWSVKMDQDPKVQFRLEDREALQAFDGAVLRRSGKAGQRYQAVWATEDGEPVEDTAGFPDQVWLWGCSWHHSSGPRIALAVPWTVFETFLLARSAGDRFYLTLVELQEDETPIDQAQAKRVERDLQTAPTLKGGPISVNCGRTCNEPDFYNFVRQHSCWRAFCQHAETAQQSHAKPGAADFVRWYCGVASRAELDHNEDAAQLWKALRSDYVQFLYDPWEAKR